jgi:hypothetical protein
MKPPDKRRKTPALTRRRGGFLLTMTMRDDESHANTIAAPAAKVKRAARHRFGGAHYAGY